MARVKLKTLPPRIAVLPDRLPTVRPARAPRIRGRELQALRARRLTEQPLCEECLRKTPPVVTVAAEIDHVRPLSRGGADVDSNRQNLCADCHKAKSAREARGE